MSTRPNSYLKKYLKYKHKYLHLKNIYGGSKTIETLILDENYDNISIGTKYDLNDIINKIKDKKKLNNIKILIVEDTLIHRMTMKKLMKYIKDNDKIEVQYDNGTEEEFKDEEIYSKYIEYDIIIHDLELPEDYNGDNFNGDIRLKKFYKHLLNTDNKHIPFFILNTTNITEENNTLNFNGIAAKKFYYYAKLLNGGILLKKNLLAGIDRYDDVPIKNIILINEDNEEKANEDNEEKANEDNEEKARKIHVLNRRNAERGLDEPSQEEIARIKSEQEIVRKKAAEETDEDVSKPCCSIQG